jgi:hypothetical protein
MRRPAKNKVEQEQPNPGREVNRKGKTKERNTPCDATNILKFNKYYA